MKKGRFEAALNCGGKDLNLRLLGYEIDLIFTCVVFSTVYFNHSHRLCPVPSKNSIVSVLKKIVRFARVVACQNASGSGSIYLSHRVYRRLDESTAAASHRISDGGKSCAAGADRQPPHAFYR